MTADKEKGKRYARAVEKSKEIVYQVCPEELKAALRSGLNTDKPNLIEVYIESKM